MQTAKRNDRHRPSVIVPADYDYTLEYGRQWVEYHEEYGKDEEWSNMPEAVELYKAKGAYVHGTRENVERAVLRCDVCGAHFKYGSLFTHRPTGEVISLGHDCADSMGLAYSRAAAGAIQQQAKRVRLAVLKRRQNFATLRKWAAANKEVLPLLRAPHRITRSMRAKLIATGARWGLSTKQVALLHKLVEQAELPPEQHVPVPVDGERIHVCGQVVSLRETDYGIRMIVKVSTDKGTWLCMGTRPQALYDQLQHEYTAMCAEYTAMCAAAELNRRKLLAGLQGRTVSFMARVTKGNRDEHFGFFSRPTKVKLHP